MGRERVLINPSAAALGQRNAIISHTGAKHLADAAGTLSIKWMPIGCSTWRTAAGAYRIEGTHFLVLNHGRAIVFNGMPSDAAHEARIRATLDGLYGDLGLAAS